MAFDPRHGKDAEFLLDNSSDALTSLTDNITSISFPQTQDNPDVTALNNNNMQFIVGLQGATISLSGIWDDDTNTHINGILGRASNDFQLDPQGQVTGDPRFTGVCLLNGYTIDISVDSATTWSVDAVVSGVVTLATVP